MIATPAPPGRRDASKELALHTMGNLTILTQELNSAVSNSGWATKRPATPCSFVVTD